MKLDNRKTKAITCIEGSRTSLIRLSHYIHDNPEIGLTEYKAVEAICSLLAEKGIEAKTGIAGIETAFQATVSGNMPGPHVALLAEYDALPKIGHGCGHNVIATCAVGAFLAVAESIGDMGGKVSLIGCPAEETVGCKCDLVNKGIFDDVGYALMMHPTSGKSIINRSARATNRMTVHFTGKAAHSSKPQSGINALSATIALFNGIDSMRASFDAGDNVNGIITDGGKAANVIPGESESLFCIRAKTVLDLNKLRAKISQAAQASAMLTGTKVEVTTYNTVYERYTNLPMSEAFKTNMAVVGEQMEYADNSVYYGSSDIGNVSIRLPIIHDYLNISERPVSEHSEEFARDAASPRADEICIKGAQGLAMTVIDLLEDPQLRSSIDAYQNRVVPAEYK